MRVIRISRRSAGALCVLIVVVGLAGCGSWDRRPDGPGHGSGPSAFAAEAAREHLSSALMSGMSGTTTASVTFTATGAGDEQSWRGDCRLGSVHSGEPTSVSFAADVTGVVPGVGKVRVISLAKASYVRMPVSFGLPSTKPWLKITTTAGESDDPASKSLRPFLAALRGSVDPMSTLLVLRISAAAKELGAEYIDRVPARKYVATIDLTDQDALKGPDGESFRALVGQGLKTLDVYMWVTGSKLPAQMIVITPYPKGTSTRQFNYSHWGKIVAIKAPPLAQIATPGLARI